MQARGWVLGSGSRFGCDMMAYRSVPVDESGESRSALARHSDVGIVVWQAQRLVDRADGTTKSGTVLSSCVAVSTRSLQARLRACHHARKSLLLLRVHCTTGGTESEASAAVAAKPESELAEGVEAEVGASAEQSSDMFERTAISRKWAT